MKTTVLEYTNHPSYSIRIGDINGLYNASWRGSCARVADALNIAGFILIREETPMETANPDNPRFAHGRDMEAFKMLDYLAYGDFNKFFQITVDVTIHEQLYLAECHESHCELPVEIESYVCCCALL